MYPDTFEVYGKHSPATNYPSNTVLVYHFTQVSINSPPEKSSQIIKLDPKYHSILHIFNSIYCQLSSQDLVNLLQLLCEFQGIYSQHKFDFSVIDIPFPITLNPNSE